MYKVKSIENLISQLTKLPGIGGKSAQRLALFLVRSSKEEHQSLIQAIDQVSKKVKQCSICGNLTEDDPCSICQNEKRDRGIICVVEQPRDVIAIEKMGKFPGLYHVLRGVISPVKGIGPGEINIKGLLERIRKGKVREVLLATDPNPEGETTAMYISRILSPLEVEVTRLAIGLPAGGDLEFADDFTLSQAFEGRRKFTWSH